MIDVVHITPHLGGGIGKAIIGLCESTKVYGIRSRIILLEEPEKPMIIENAINKGVDVVFSPDEVAAKEVINNADIIIVNWWDHPLSNKFLYNNNTDSRFVIWCHTNGCSYPYFSPDFLLQFDRILFTTPYSLMNETWDENKKQRIMRNSSVVYGFGDFEASRIKCRTSYKCGNKIRIGYAGTLNYSKMFPGYIDYIDTVFDFVDNVEIHFAGDISDDLRKDIDESSYRSKYILDGYVLDMDAWYDSIDIFLYLLNPSHYGTTENSILEAMSRGLPVVLMNNAAERCISGDGEGAILISDNRQFVREIKKLCKDITYREKTGVAGRKYACKHYSSKINIIMFAETMSDIMMTCKKTKHDFVECIGKSPIEWFLSSTGNDRNIFERFMTTGETKDLYELLSRKAIYTVETKSSINQFFSYFTDDKKLKTLKEVIQKEQNK